LTPGEELERDREAAYSLHDFRWDHALYAGRKIFGASFPTDVTVFLIEAGHLGYGLELTEPVSRAADRVVADIEAIVRRYAAAST
jgi:hydrogenase maturation protease